MSAPSPSPPVDSSNSRTRCSGSLLIEGLLATALLATVALLLGESLIWSSQAAHRYGMRRRASFLTEEGIEAVRALRSANLSSPPVSSPTFGLQRAGGGWVLSGTEDVTENAFTRRISIESVSPEVKRATATVSYRSLFGTDHTVSLQTLLTNWQEPLPPPPP